MTGIKLTAADFGDFPRVSVRDVWEAMIEEMIVRVVARAIREEVAEENWIFFTQCQRRNTP